MYDRPDPKGLWFYDYYAPVINVTLILTFFIVPAWMLLCLVYIAARYNKEKFDWHIFLYSLGPVLAFVVYEIAAEWFLD